jgi:hypothetical protein
MTPTCSGLTAAAITLALAGLIAPAVARAGDDPAMPNAAAAESAASPSAAAIAPDGLEHLVPALASNPYRLEPGVRPYLDRLSVSPGFGHLGSERLFLMRVAYNPNAWLGYEGTIGHNPNHSVQGIIDRCGVIVRRPLPGRFQPYVTAGYGMTIVLPGRSINADPVTKNALTYGGGLELFIRGDLALRAELLGNTVIGRQQSRQGLVAYDYREETIALAFYRTLRP